MPVTAWVVGAVEPTPAGMDQLRSQVAMYVGAPGYGEMFEQAGFGDVVDRARAGAPRDEVRASVPDGLLESVAMIGSRSAIEQRLGDYRDAGVSQVAVVPVTADDRGGRRTLAAVSAFS
jgi:hypothetical protein